MENGSAQSMYVRKAMINDVKAGNRRSKLVRSYISSSGASQNSNAIIGGDGDAADQSRKSVQSQNKRRNNSFYTDNDDAAGVGEDLLDLLGGDDTDSEFDYYSYASEEEEKRLEMAVNGVGDYEFYDYSDDGDDDESQNSEDTDIPQKQSRRGRGQTNKLTALNEETEDLLPDDENGEAVGRTILDDAISITGNDNDDDDAAGVHEKQSSQSSGKLKKRKSLSRSQSQSKKKSSVIQKKKLSRVSSTSRKSSQPQGDRPSSTSSSTQIVKSSKVVRASADLTGQLYSAHDMIKEQRRTSAQPQRFLNERPLDARRVKGIRKGLNVRRRRKATQNGISLKSATMDEVEMAKREHQHENGQIVGSRDKLSDDDSVYSMQLDGDGDDNKQEGEHNRAFKEKKRHVQANKKIPKALYDPKVRKQLAKLKTYYPYFTYMICFVNLVVLGYEFYLNYSYTGELIAPPGTNFMIGPYTQTLIASGARFVPCMKNTSINGNFLVCQNGFPHSNLNATGFNITSGNLCTLQDFCGMGGFSKSSVPDQWWRLITAMFLHAGLVHFIMNTWLMIQVGRAMEEAYGSVRIMIIYFVSGIAGFLFAADLEQTVPTVGASGSIFGVLGVVLLDLILNFKIVQNRWKELSIHLAQIIISVAFGLLPYIDNFAHIGGFVTGLLSGLLLMPALTFSKMDKLIKRTVRFLSLPLLGGFLFWLFYSFLYQNGSNCPWCKYLDCIPINGWCDGYSS
ncbi:hypothetical protein MIR68_001701 [Amoeboaphelidium protococcarum]|nr:hypothetical protein MIR68_001701 [Amoeboaphelidium protococcarum]